MHEFVRNEGCLNFTSFSRLFWTSHLPLIESDDNISPFMSLVYEDDYHSTRLNFIALLTMTEALCDFGSHLLKAYVFKSFDLLSLCDFGPHLLEACVFESFDFVYSPVTCFDVRRENWALGVWSSPVMIVWMISRTKVIM